MHITREQYLMGREVQYPTTELIEINIAVLLFRVNKLISVCPDDCKPAKVTSGYRPGHYNTIAGGAKKSSHLTGEAIDLADANGKFKQWIVANQKLLADFGLYMEAPIATPTWCHLQTRATGARIFNP